MHDRPDVLVTFGHSVKLLEVQQAQAGSGSISTPNFAAACWAACRCQHVCTRLERATSIHTHWHIVRVRMWCVCVCLCVCVRTGSVTILSMSCLAHPIRTPGFMRVASAMALLIAPVF